VHPENGITEFVATLPAALAGYREMVLANLVMLGEIPAPTFHERARIEFLKQRFTEYGLHNVSTDEAGNGTALLLGTTGKQNILVSAHADTPFPENTDHVLALYPERVIGPGVADNSLGLSMVATLPMVLELLDIRLQSSLILMGATQSLGCGDQAGLRFFLDNTDIPVSAGISVEGVQLGRLNYASLAAIDAEITCKVLEPQEPSADSCAGAIPVMNHVIQRLCEQVPPDALVLGAITGGTAYKTPARSATLRIKLHEESGGKLSGYIQNLDRMVEQISAETGVEVRFEIIARTKAGGLDLQHPLVQQTQGIIQALDVEPARGRFSTSISSFLEKGIPALTIGLTDGRHLNQPDEEIEIEPVFKGLAQLIGILLAIDGGCCDRH
jgi:acetylornithine deacetylase/succinyl-diaminopimelate desuccinylase-like protein